MNPVILLAAALHGTAHPYPCAKGSPAAEMPFCNGKLAVAVRANVYAKRRGFPQHPDA
eukprot:gene11737-28819_t